MLARRVRQQAMRWRRPGSSRRFATDGKEKTAETAENVAAAATPAPPRPGFFSRHPEIIFLGGLLGIGGYIYRSSVNNSKFNELQNDIAEKTPISPYEAYELRSQNTISPELFETIKKQAKRYFPSNEATVAEFDLCLGSVLKGTAMKNTHHLERVLLSLPKNANGKVNLDLLLVAFSLAVKGGVDERLQCLFQLPLTGTAVTDATLTKAQIQGILGHILETYQIPSEKRVVALEDKAYPYQEYAVATPEQIFTAAVGALVKAKTLEQDIEAYNLEQFNLLMKSKAVCIWGECYNSSSKKRMNN
ncbi:unnamed protein product [Aphanomyces euteiches]|uniref:EF-hand domain-containing protein n=1 Tax=Aphanomyces euteiches TaxID=100861 RepID=A0A6G0WJZ1_9STRA|nr:hypothetical protein Ae201684_014396 [Aphanomyces euteiches]KAH9158190.1 hypothetical protein AeRB84_000023 [Aphanomyces euteiches]